VRAERYLRNRINFTLEFQERVTYDYDVFGNRVSRTTFKNGATEIKHFAYDGANLWGDLNEVNDLELHYLLGDQAGQRYGLITPQGFGFWYTMDRAQTVRERKARVSGTVIVRKNGS